MNSKETSRNYKSVLLFFIVAVVALVAVSGKLLVVECAPVKSDAIVVLSGLDPDRPKEAALLYHEGYADTVIITTPALQGHELGYAQEGISLVPREDLFKELMVKKKFQSLT